MIKSISAAILFSLLASCNTARNFEVVHPELDNAEIFLETMDVYYHFGYEWIIVSKALSLTITGETQVLVRY